MDDKLQIKSLCSHVSLEVEEAVSLGLILNELITNSARHGMIEGQQLIIKVLVYFIKNGELFVSVENNGKRLDKINLLNQAVKE